MSSAQTIPSTYRVFFTIIDPILCTGGIITTWIFPQMFLQSFFPHPTITPETRLSLDVNAGFFSAILVLQICLLRVRPNDITLWQVVEAAILLTDVATLAGFARVASSEGRLGLGSWTLYEWSDNVILTVAVLIRTAFVLGVGLKGGKGKVE
jgi:hypothetical protein